MERQSSNIVCMLENRRLGYNMPKRLDLAYNSLKTLAGDLKFFYDGSGTRTHCPVFVAKFCPIKNHEGLLISANEDGRITLLNTSKPVGKKVVHSYQAHQNSIFDLAWLDQELAFLSASGDHSSVLWRVVEGGVKSVFLCYGHKHSVKTISCKPEDRNTFATGGRDGSLMIWDTRIHTDANLVLHDKAIKHSHENPGYLKARRSRAQTNSVTGLVFQDEHNLISCSAGDGLIKVWDMRKTYTIRENKLPQAKFILPYSGTGRNGYSNLAISPCRQRLYGSCIDNFIYCYNVGTYSEKPVAKYWGHVSDSFYLKNSVSPDGSYISCGSRDGKTYVWSTAKSTPIVRLSGHAAEVTCVDWAKAGELKMVTCSDDSTIRVWKLYPQINNEDNPDVQGFAEIYLNDSCDTPNVQKKRKHRSSIYLQNENDDPRQETEKRQKLNTSTHMSQLTADLPNFVVDGTSPHVHHCTHTPKAKDKNWLNNIKERTAQVPQVSPQRSINRKKPTNMNSTPRGTILQYFKASSSLCEDTVSTPDNKKT